MKFSKYVILANYKSDTPEGLAIHLNEDKCDEVLGLDIKLVFKSIELHVQAFTEMKMSEEQMHTYINKTIAEVRKLVQANNVIRFMAAIEYMERNEMIVGDDGDGIVYMQHETVS